MNLVFKCLSIFFITKIVNVYYREFKNYILGRKVQSLYQEATLGLHSVPQSPAFCSSNLFCVYKTPSSYFGSQILPLLKQVNELLRDNLLK